MLPELKPAEGKLVIQFLEDREDGESSSVGDYGSPSTSEACFALVLAAGLKTSAKKGQTVLVSGWARNDPEVDEGIVITDNWSILAVVSAA